VIHQAKKYLKNLLTLLSALSLDVALGASSSTYFAFSVCYHHEINKAHFLGLFFSIIFFYSSDHLFDLYRTRNTERSDRRKYHAKLKPLFILLGILSLISIFPLLFYLNIHVVYSGLVLAIGLGLYFFIINTFETHRIKDLLVSIGYTLGIWIPVFSYQINSFNWNHGIAMSLFFLNTFITMLIYAFLDLNSDKKEHIESFFSTFSSLNANRFLKISVISNFLMSFFLFEFTGLAYLLPLMLHAALLALFTFYKQLNPTSVRWLGEYSYLIYFFWAFINF
jgi:hypothetical protein